jgi:hypothetical protein
MVNGGSVRYILEHQLFLEPWQRRLARTRVEPRQHYRLEPTCPTRPLSHCPHAPHLVPELSFASAGPRRTLPSAPAAARLPVHHRGDQRCNAATSLFDSHHHGRYSPPTSKAQAAAITTKA